MTEDQARMAYTDYCTQKGREVQAISAEHMKDGSWLFVEVDEPSASVRGSNLRLTYLSKERGRWFQNDLWLNKYVQNGSV